jgi:circadian clock protein KaiB
MNVYPIAATSNEKKLNPTKFIFELFVSDNSPNSIRAIANIKALFEKHLMNQYVLKVIDIFENPEMAVTENVLAIPLLIKKQPLPEIRMIGDFSNSEKVLHEFLIGLT